VRAEDIRNWLKGEIEQTEWRDAWVGAHKIDLTAGRAACVFYRKGAGKRAIGEAEGYLVLPLSVLIRGGEDPRGAEEFANAVYNMIRGRCAENEFYKVTRDWPTEFGTDGKGVYEYGVDFDAYFAKQGA
jgi:hypothetical protein